MAAADGHPQPAQAPPTRARRRLRRRQRNLTRSRPRPAVAGPQPPTLRGPQLCATPSATSTAPRGRSPRKRALRSRLSCTAFFAARLKGWQACLMLTGASVRRCVATMLREGSDT
jgi:hypothetical protein